MNSRAQPGQAYIPTNVEHIANMVTHGVSHIMTFTVHANLLHSHVVHTCNCICRSHGGQSQKGIRFLRDKQVMKARLMLTSNWCLRRIHT